MAKDKQQKRNWDKVPWTHFQEANYDESNPIWKKYKEDQGVQVFINSIYQVEVSVIQCPKPFGDVVYLSLKTKDKQARHDWREMQRIKNEFVGNECEAIELFPAESRMVDTSNQFHMYCFPELDFQDHKFPFGYVDRLVTEGSTPDVNNTGKGSRQRDFRPEFRPPDLVHNTKLTDLVNGKAFLGGQCPADRSPWVMGGVIKMRGPNGTLVSFSKAECMKGEHIAFFSLKKDYEDAERQRTGNQLDDPLGKTLSQESEHQQPAEAGPQSDSSEVHARGG